jgi:20S proteasome subunit beta 5
MEVFFNKRGGGGHGLNEETRSVTSSFLSSLVLPPNTSDPAAYASSRFDVYKGDEEGEHSRISFAKGTTTLAFRFKGGIVVSVDSRSTQGPYIGE